RRCRPWPAGKSSAAWISSIRPQGKPRDVQNQPIRLYLRVPCFFRRTQRTLPRQAARFSISFLPMDPLRTARGRSLPLGTTALADGVNFAVLCRHGTAVALVVYPLEDEPALAEISLDPSKNRTGNHWHILVAGLPPAFRYGWRVQGPMGDGHHFDPNLVLLDPATTAVTGGALWGE